VSTSLPYDSLVASRDAIEDREVDEAEARGESMGDWIAVDGDETSDSAVLDVMVRLSAGCLAAGTFAELVTAAIVSGIPSFGKIADAWRLSKKAIFENASTSTSFVNNCVGGRSRCCGTRP